MRIVEMHEMLEHLLEGAALARLERLKDQPLRRLHRRLDVANKPPARRRDVQRLGAPVMRAIDAGDELLALQAADHPADRAAVKGDDVAQRGLIDPGMTVDCDQCGILHRRHRESLGMVEEQGEGNLVQPANEMARHLDEAAVADRFRHGYPVHARCRPWQSRYRHRNTSPLTAALDCRYTDNNRQYTDEFINVAWVERKRNPGAAFEPALSPDFAPLNPGCGWPWEDEMPEHPEARPETIVAGKKRPFTGAGFLESLRDG